MSEFQPTEHQHVRYRAHTVARVEGDLSCVQVQPPARGLGAGLAAPHEEAVVGPGGEEPGGGEAGV